MHRSTPPCGDDRLPSFWLVNPRRLSAVIFEQVGGEGGKGEECRVTRVHCLRFALVDSDGPTRGWRPHLGRAAFRRRHRYRGLRLIVRCRLSPARPPQPFFPPSALCAAGLGGNVFQEVGTGAAASICCTTTGSPKYSLAQTRVGGGEGWSPYLTTQPRERALSRAASFPTLEGMSSVERPCSSCVCFPGRLERALERMGVYVTAA